MKDAEDQEYAKIGKALGSGRFNVTIFSDDSEKIGTVCGSLYKRVWMREGDKPVNPNAFTSDHWG